jgi:Ca2+-binding RTX toxin-like protein
MIVSGQEGTLLDHDETSAEFKTRFGNDTKLYTGHDFSYDGDTLVGGTITEISYKASGGDYYRITDISLGATDDQSSLFSGDDIFIGSRTNNYLYGEAGDDRIRGGKGEDYIRGGTGDDILRGGMGSDHFVFSIGDGSDTIYGFDGNGSDRDIIQINDVNKLSELTISQVGKDVVIEFGGDDRITLRDFDLHDFSPRNFDFG